MIKVCGMRDPENIRVVSRLPLDMVGFVFYPASPRYVKGNALERWLTKEPDAIPSTVKRVGVFVNAEIEDVLNRIHDFSLDYIQLHGKESPGYCAELHQLWQMTTMRKAGIIKAFSVDADFDFSTCNGYAPYCDYFLFDTKTPAYGGSGMQFDWSLLERYPGKTPFLLSGGIGPDSVEALQQFHHPNWAGIDLNSRFETAPGVKDAASISAFVRQIFEDSLG